ncbi:hypothetical protein B0H13DRAFT_2386441 [Mycena leptocephala]|nr:hypothetical protein B0H13DRAFT_2386441 [Mycena leptocephala]
MVLARTTPGVLSLWSEVSPTLGWSGHRSLRLPVDKDADKRPAKKPRKTTEKKNVTSAARIASAEPLPEEETIENMAEHMHAPTWDQLIKNIDTVVAESNLRWKEVDHH